MCRDRLTLISACKALPERVKVDQVWLEFMTLKGGDVTVKAGQAAASELAVKDDSRVVVGSRDGTTALTETSGIRTSDAFWGVAWDDNLDFRPL